jgi:hypothetical protein
VNVHSQEKFEDSKEIRRHNSKEDRELKKRKTTGQAMTYKTKYRKLKVKGHEPH